MAEKGDGVRLKRVDLTNEMKQGYIDYSMSVIVARALPDVRDGFKPVHRRILFGMQGIGNVHNSPFKKSARIVGDVLGKYHPHGDSSVYGALVRLAQPWSLRYPLVEGQGNFGSVDGDSPAAMRYTEARLSLMGEAMMEDLGKDTVDMVPNFDGSLMEPAVLPSLFPNLLVNGSNGIAVGMATNIPTHNLREVIDGCVAVLDNPGIDIDELMEHIKAPDFGTGGMIMGLDGVREAYKTGRGRIVVRGRAEIEGNGLKDQIVISEIPYGVNKAELVKHIAELATEKKIAGITNANDESDREGMRIVVDVRKDANARVILNKLYKMTALQTAFSMNCIALVPAQEPTGGETGDVLDFQAGQSSGPRALRPRLLNLKEVLVEFLKHREEVTYRRSAFDLKKARERAHIVEALVACCDNIDEVVALIRASRNVREAMDKLGARFGFDELQAKAIVEMRLGQLTGLRQEELRNELAGLRQRMAELEEILGSKEKLRSIVREELKAVGEKFGDSRKTEIVPMGDDSFNAEDFYSNDPVVITLSHKGYIKRMPLGEFKAQSRGGIGLRAATQREEDFTEAVYSATMHNTMLFFTERGRCYWLKVYDLPEGARVSKGRAIQNMLNLSGDDSVKACLVLRKLGDSEWVDSHYVVFCTRGGTVKKTALRWYSRPRTNGVTALNIQDGDSLVSVVLTNGNQDLVIADRNGRAIRFHESAVRDMGRAATGVRGMKLGEDDEVVGMVPIVDKEKDTLLVLSERGYGKRSAVDDYRITNRGAQGVKTLQITEKTGRVVAILNAVDDRDLMIINKSGTAIRQHISDIRVMGRNTQGVKLIDILKRNDEISSVCSVPQAPSEEGEKSEE